MCDCVICLATRKAFWVTEVPTQEGYYWMYDDNHFYIVYIRKHPIAEGRWQMAFGGPATLANGNWYMISEYQEEDPGMYRSAEPIAPPLPPPVTPV